jgi:hypothetical protein
MRLLKTNTATRVSVGPFLDKTDGITPEVALTVTNCKLTFVVDTGGVPTLVLDTNPTASGGSNDMVHITNDDAGFYDLELAAANVNYVGRAMLALTDAANHCPVFHEFMILPANVYDALVGGTDNLQVDAVEVSSDTTTADNLQTAFQSTLAELGSVPAANAPLWTKIGWLFLKARNKITQTATAQVVKADDGSTTVATSTVSDDGTTATRGEFA